MNTSMLSPREYVIHQLELEIGRSNRIMEAWRNHSTDTVMNTERVIKWWMDIIEIYEYALTIVKERDISLEEIVKENGFESEKEFNKLVASVDISTYEKVVRFKKWQHEDATKEGLLKIIEENGVKS
jgi:hypothetical protein